jgi:hypothetical protein
MRPKLISQIDGCRQFFDVLLGSWHFTPFPMQSLIGISEKREKYFKALSSTGAAVCRCPAAIHRFGQ